MVRYAMPTDRVTFASIVPQLSSLRLVLKGQTIDSCFPPD